MINRGIGLNIRAFVLILHRGKNSRRQNQDHTESALQADTLLPYRRRQRRQSSKNRSRCEQDGQHRGIQAENRRQQKQRQASPGPCLSVGKHPHGGSSQEQQPHNRHTHIIKGIEVRCQVPVRSCQKKKCPRNCPDPAAQKAAALNQDISTGRKQQRINNCQVLRGKRDAEGLRQKPHHRNRVNHAAFAIRRKQLPVRKAAIARALNYMIILQCVRVFQILRQVFQPGSLHRLRIASIVYRAQAIS